MSRAGGQDSGREPPDIPRLTAVPAAAPVDGAGDPGQAARQDLVLPVEWVEVDRIRLAVQAAQHGEHGARVVAGGDQEGDRALVGLDLVVALVGQVAAGGAGIGRERPALDLEEVVAVVERHVGHLVGQERGQLGLGAQAAERAGGDVDEPTQERVALRVGIGQDPEEELEVGAAGAGGDPAADRGHVGGQPAVGVKMKNG